MVSRMHPKPMAPEIAEVLSKVQLPLSNIEYHIERYLLEHGSRLDTQTRILLARVRDSIGTVADTTRGLSQTDHRTAREVEHAA